jgi:thiol-disulfide isomerase/thioredoxin
MARKTSSASARARASLQATRSTTIHAHAARSQNGAPAARMPAGQPPRRRQLSTNMGGWILTGTVLLVVAIVIFAIVKGNSNAQSGVTPGQLNQNNVPLKVGVVAPDFSLPAEQGGTYSLSQYRGKVVLLEFFAPYCPYCRAEAPTLHQLAASSGASVQLLAVTASPYGFNYESTGDTSPITMHDVKLYVDQFNVNYPALFDVTLKAGNDYGVVGYPQMYVIDRNGVITWGSGLSGAVSYGTLQQEIQKAMLVPLATAMPMPTATPHK